MQPAYQCALFAGVFSLLATGTVAASIALSVECAEGCLAPEDDQTADLLLRADESSSVTIRWRAAQNPVPAEHAAVLYAGNPAIRQVIPSRGALKFEPTERGWEAVAEFGAGELGRGSFLAVVSVRRAAGSPDNEEILDWRAFRLLTKADSERRKKLPDPGGNWSIDVRPALLRVTTGRGDLPRARGGGQPVWWSLNERQGDTTDLDIDGENSGVPGVTVQVSTPWQARPDSLKEEVLKQLGLADLKGHEVRFDDLTWFEAPDREFPLKDVGTVLLRHYYTVVTLFTNASVKTFDEKELGRTSLFFPSRYFSHETTANLKPPEDPRFWASYSQREYSSDPRLLNLLAQHVGKHRSVPGLGPVQVDSGDGGSVLYHVGFYARVRPWQAPQVFNAGFVGLDVVAARAGVGGPVAQGSTGDSALRGIWCQVVGCGKSGGKELDLGKPPDGYRVATPVAALATLPGNLPMIGEKPVFAERRVPPSTTLPSLPDATRFGITANLRSGALIQKPFLRDPTDVIPINSYAQFVVKMTVGMLPKTVMVASEEAIMPVRTNFSPIIVVNPASGLWAWLAGAAAVGLVLAFVFIPGFRQFVSAVFALLAAFINRLARLIGPRS